MPVKSGVKVDEEMHVRWLANINNWKHRHSRGICCCEAERVGGRRSVITEGGSRRAGSGSVVVCGVRNHCPRWHGSVENNCWQSQLGCWKLFDLLTEAPVTMQREEEGWRYWLLYWSGLLDTLTLSIYANCQFHWSAGIERAGSMLLAGHHQCVKSLIFVDPLNRDGPASWRAWTALIIGWGESCQIQRRFGSRWSC